MKNNTPNSNPKFVSVIGVRNYPAEFVGTSGVEAYTEAVIDQIHKQSHFKFTVYTKSAYSKQSSPNLFVRTIPVFTVTSKVFESILYSFLASLRAATDNSHVVWYQGTGPALFAWIPKLSGKKIVVTIHSLDWNRKKWNVLEKTAFRLISTMVLKQKYHMCAVSSKVQNRLKNSYYTATTLTPPGTPQTVSTDPMYLNKYSLTPNTYLLYLGRIVPEKRLEWLIDTFVEQIVSKHSELKLVIAGGSVNMPQYEQELKKRTNHPNVVWTGYIFGHEKATLLVNCRCFVLPSEIEGHPISLMEALTYKKRCIVSESWLPSELAEHALISTFTSTSRTDFNRKLQKALNHHESSNQPPTDPAVPAIFSWRRTAQKYLQLLQIKS